MEVEAPLPKQTCAKRANIENTTLKIPPPATTSAGVHPKRCQKHGIVQAALIKDSITPK